MYRLTPFIIFIVSHMVQSAPLNHDQRIRRETDSTIKRNFYCAAKLFKDNAQILDHMNISISLADIPVDDRTAVLCQLYNHFSEECKNFTKAMSLKHQLQDYLFNQDSSSLHTDQAEYVHSILVGLQTTADVLDQYQFSQHSKNCLRLPAAQYKMMRCKEFSTALLVNDILKLGDSWVHDHFPIYGGNKTTTC